MENKLSIISLEDPADPDYSPIEYYSLTNSSTPLPSNFSFDYPFLVKGMLFGLCLKGNAKIRIDFKECSILPNTLFTIIPNQILEPLEKSDDHYIEYLFFSTDFVSTLPLPKDFDIFNKMIKSPCLYLSEESMQELIEYHSFITRACDRSKYIRNENVAKSLMYAFIALMSSFYTEAEINSEPKSNLRGNTIVEEFSKLLMQYHKIERKASFYADKLCITTPYLSRTLKKITGRSVNTWITEAVILEAKVLLKSSDVSILEISEELNFPNPSFFIRYFKQYAGITPLKYRDS